MRDTRSSTEDGASGATVPRSTAWVVIVGLVLCAVVVVRQAERDALRLGGTPVPTAIPLPTTMLVRQTRPPPTAEAPTTVPRAAPPAGGPASSAGVRAPALAPAELERLGIAKFREARDPLFECLAEERQRRPGVGGKLEIAVQSDSNGLVLGVRLGDSPVRSPAFDECVTLAVADLVFEPQLAGREISVTLDLR